MKKKQVSDVFGSNEVARICNVNRMLVIKWIDSGLLKSYRLPPSDFRRVKKQDLIEFMKKHNIPMENVPGPRKPVALICCRDSVFARKIEKVLSRCADLDVRLAASKYELGKSIATVQPALLILSDGLIPLKDKKTLKEIISDVGRNKLAIIGVGPRKIASKEMSGLKKSRIDAYFATSTPIKELQDGLREILRRKGLARPATE